MMKRKNANKGRINKQLQRVTSARTTTVSRLSGDVPRREPVDQRTSSIKVPRPSGLLQYRQLAPIQTFTVTAGAATAPVVTFALNGVVGSATLSSLFDFYRIDAIQMTLRPNNNALSIVDPTVTQLVPIYWVIDYNDSVSLASTGAATEYDNCMVITPGESAERTFQPMYSLTVRSNAGTDYVSRVGDWLPTASDDILHFGCKFYIPAGGAVQTFLQTWTLEIAYFFSFRQVS